MADPGRTAVEDAPSDRPTRAEEQLRRLVEAVQDYAILSLDPQGRILTWNVGAERIIGYPASEALGRHFSMFYPPDAADQDWPRKELAAAAAQGRFEDEGWRVRKDGTRFWANVIVTAVRDDAGRITGFSKILRDLTERRRHEEELRQSEERFRLMVEAVRDYAIFMLDPRGVVASWNPGAERIKGYKAEEIIGQHFSKFYPEEKIAERWPDYELKEAARVGRFEDEGWRIRKDGSRFWANVVISAVHDHSGTLRGFVKVTRDLTERRQKERLEEEGRQTSEFLAMLGHELRNPLAPIRNAVAVMGARDLPDPTIAWARDLIERQVGHLSRLVDDLLDVSRITRGKIVLHKEPVDLGGVVSRAIDTARPLLDQRRHHLETDLGHGPVRIEGDATRLAQVVTNLLNNAAKYTPEGGHIWVRLHAERADAVLEVADDGIGISPELLPRVFELFTQGERSLDRSEGGLGIGLTLVQRLVALHGGTVEARSAGPGKGSLFEVRLPLAAAPPAPGEESRRTADRPAPTPSRVLVVDDNRDASDTMAMLLRLWGHDVVVATEGGQALAEIERQRPAIVLLDIGLPGIDGYEVARRIRADERNRDVVLVAMTGYGQAEDRQRALDAGFNLHLVKPVEPDALKHLLASIDRPSRS